jgi:hypothetical protein
MYPSVDSTMLPHERAHAYHINLTALTSQNLDLRLQLDALGHQLNLQATVDGVVNDWLRFFYDHWCDFRHLTILSFHDTTGDVNEDTRTAADPAVLLPVQDGNIAQCRRPGIKFVRVQISLDFVSLVNVAAPSGPTTLRTEYYLELPQTTRVMTNENRGAYNLMTFHGPDDLRTLSPADVKAQLLDKTLQDGPVELMPASFGLRTARTGGEALRTEIDQKILKLAFRTVCHTLFLELCPGYSTQPHAALDHIRQVHMDKDGNQVISSVQSYFQQLMSAARPFTNQRDFPISVCAKFIDGLDSRLLTGFRRFFPGYSNVQSLNATHQRKVLQEMLQAAQQAEDDLASVQRVAREAVGLSQAFVSSGSSVASTAFPSQAEKTLAKYSYQGSGASTDGSRASESAGSKNGKVGLWPCFGCGGPHPWSKFVDGKYVIICPNKDNPGVAQNAAKGIERMRKNRKKRHAQNVKRKNLGTANFSDFDEAGQKRIREQVLQTIGGREVGDGASVASSVTTPSTLAPGGGAGRGRGRRHVFVVDVPVLAVSPLKQQMPIAIQSNLPHIILKLGHSLDSPNCPEIRMAVDTCAALTTGSFHFYAQIAKRFPQCVEKIYAPQDYAAIVLSGIVQKGEAAVTTELEVCFQFHLPYKTKDGDDASFMIATGPHVSVNTILGLPFQLATGAIVDFVDMVVECKHLDCPPFPIDFRRTSNHVPVMDKTDAPVQLTEFRDVIREIEHLERYYDAKVQAGSSSSSTTHSGVHFGSRSAARPAVIDSCSVDSASYHSSGFSSRWVPPPSVHVDDSDYQSSVLGKDSYL